VGSHAEVPIEVSFYEAMHGSERQLQVRIDGQQRDLTVRVPAGIHSGKKLRVKGKGHRGPGGNGDLLLTVQVSADERFERDGDDLHTSARVQASDLLLGGTATVETLAGERRLKVKAGTASGTRLRIRGAGAPVLGKSDNHGDLYVRLEVVPPEELDEDQRAAAEALRESGL
jgi:curved DNA-binding protein